MLNINLHSPPLIWLYSEGCKAVLGGSNARALVTHFNFSDSDWEKLQYALSK